MCIKYKLFSGIGGKPGCSKPCHACNGMGFKMKLRQIAPGMVQQSHTVCGECGGSKEVIPQKDRCPTCNGNKVIREKKMLCVEIDKGMMVSCVVKSQFFRIIKISASPVRVIVNPGLNPVISFSV